MNEGKSTIRVLGIDPGLHITGYGAIETNGRDFRILEAGVIRTKLHIHLAGRLVHLHGDLTSLLAEIRPDMAGMEKLYAHYKHPATAILMGHARGALMLACAQADVEVTDMPSTLVKRALTGNGHASKLQVQRSIQALCKLPELPEPPDVADALAIAICAGRHAMGLAAR